MATLKGMTWDHARGYVPLVATSQALSDINPDMQIIWDKRSLWAFGEAPIEVLLESYDMIIMDHPMIGYAVQRGLLLPLDEYLPADFLAQQTQESVGPSYRSYSWGNHQWALAVDAAAQVSASRPDLITEQGLSEPESWEEVMELARQTGKVAIPLRPIDALCSFFTLCANQGEPPFQTEGEHVVSHEMGRYVLEQLRQMLALVDPTCLTMNPIQVLNRMSFTDDALYTPLTFGYSNYGRNGYVRRKLAFHDIPAAGQRGCQGATLGGAGLAISARSAARDQALEYARWVVSAECQRSMYVLSGGQPGNRIAWEDELANLVTNNFFRATLRTLDGAYLRPTYDGFAPFQTSAAEILTEFLRDELTHEETLKQFDALYRDSRVDDEG